MITVSDVTAAFAARLPTASISVDTLSDMTIAWASIGDDDIGIQALEDGGFVVVDCNAAPVSVAGEEPGFEFGRLDQAIAAAADRLEEIATRSALLAA